MSVTVFGAVAPWVVVAAGGWIAYRLLLQNGRIIQSLDGMDAALAELVGGSSIPVDEGLAAGLVAPAFELPAIEGDPVSLEQFKGKRVLLTFFSASCVYCELAAPKLAALPVDGSGGRPVPLIVSSATADEMRAIAAKHGLKCQVLIQKGAAVSNEYKTTSTPSGYLIDEEGYLISDLVVGSEELLEMATNPQSPLIKTGQNVAFLGMPKPQGS